MFNPTRRSHFLESDWFFHSVLAAFAFFPNLFLGRVYFDGDLHMQYEIFQEFLKKNIFLGHFPLWNPYLFGGQPQSAMDPEKTLFLMDRSGGDSAILDSGSASFQYQWEKDEPDDEAFHLNINRDHWVVFSEVNYPGWKAWVDGRPIPIQTVDYTFRGLFLKAGTHQVEFRFEPSWWRVLILD